MTEEDHMIVLGLILLILGWVLGIGILVTIGIIVLVIGIVFLSWVRRAAPSVDASIGTERVPGWRQALALAASQAAFVTGSSGLWSTGKLLAAALHP